MSPENNRYGHNIFRSALVAAVLLTAACQTEAETPPKIEQRVEGGPKMGEIAEKLDYPALAEYRDPPMNTYRLNDHTIEVYVLSYIERHSRFIESALPFFADPAAMLPAFNITDPEGSVQYDPRISPTLKHTFLVAPSDLRSRTSDLPFSGEIYTAAPETTNKLNGETYSVLPIKSGEGPTDYEKKANSYERSIFTEMCQALVAVEPVKIPRDDENYLIYRSIGQEMYCNGLSHAFGAAQAGFEYADYLHAAKRTKITLPTIPTPLPSLVVPESTYERFREFKADSELR